MSELIRDGRQNTIQQQGIAQASGLQGVATSWDNVGDIGRELIRKGQEVERAAAKRYASESMLDAITNVGQASRDFYEDPDGFVATSQGYMEAAIEAAPDEAKDTVRNFYTNLIAQKSEGIRNRLFNEEVAAAEAANLAAFDGFVKDQANALFEQGVAGLASGSTFDQALQTMESMLVDTGKSPEQVNNMLVGAKGDLISAAVQSEARRLGKAGSVEEWQRFSSDFLGTGEDSVLFGEDMSPDERMSIVRSAEASFNNEIALLQGDLKDKYRSMADDMRLAASNGKRFDKSRAVELAQDLRSANLSDMADALDEQVLVQDYAQNVSSLSFIEQDLLLDQFMQQDQLSREDNLKFSAVSDIITQRNRQLMNDPIGFYERKGLAVATERVQIGAQDPETIAGILAQRQKNIEAIMSKDGSYLRANGISVPLWREGELEPLRSLGRTDVPIDDKVAVMSSVSQSLTNEQARSMAAQLYRGDDEQRVAAYIIQNGNNKYAQQNIKGVIRGMAQEPVKEESMVRATLNSELSGITQSPAQQQSIIDVVRYTYRDMMVQEGMAGEPFNEDVFERAREKIIGPYVSRGGLNPMTQNNTFLPPRGPDGQFMRQHQVNAAIDNATEDILAGMKGSMPLADSDGTAITIEEFKNDAVFLSGGGGDIIVADPSGAPYKDSQGRDYTVSLTDLYSLVPSDVMREFLINERGRQIRMRVPSVRFGGLTPDQARTQAEREIDNE